MKKDNWIETGSGYIAERDIREAGTGAFWNGKSMCPIVSSSWPPLGNTDVSQAVKFTALQCDK